MPLSVGQELGPYQIEEAAGAGGMGEVYRARDTRLDRTVAIKILPESMSLNADFRARFEREAKAISSLNHPNICTLHDIGQDSGQDYLVMEFLDGETLADRLASGSMELPEIMKIATQISEALDSAHRQGLVHRDLKPGNVMLTPEGAKLLDFGLAKLQAFEGGVDGLSHITQTTPLTGAGTILGTIQYMAPEQLEGVEADARSDIFSFGVMLYEMLAGHKAFTGKSQASLIASILKEQVRPISEIRPMSPPALDRLVKKCLAKDPDNRWQSTRDLSDELRWISQSGSEVGVSRTVARQRRFRFRLAWVATFVSAVMAGYFGITLLTQTVPEKEVARFSVDIEQGLTDVFWPRISPDGKLIAFHANDSTGVNRIWVRPISSLEAYPLLNTEDAKRFFWSYNSQHVAFFVGNQLKRIPVTGGQAQLICDGPNGADGTWGAGDMIVFDGSVGDTMRVVPAGGGLPVAASLLDTARGETNHAWPWFLPDGEHFIFTAPVRSDVSEFSTHIKLAKVGRTESTFLYELDNVDRVEYSFAGYILYVERGNLMALPFDADALEVTGQPKPIAMKIGSADNAEAFGVSDNGMLLYQTNTTSSQSELAWFDRAGERVSTVGQRGAYMDLALSPDRRRIAYTMNNDESNAPDIWTYDLRRNVPTRLTFDPGIEAWPIWSHDGQHIFFTSDRAGSFDIYRKVASGLDSAELFYQNDSINIGPNEIGPEGRYLMFTMVSDNWDIGVLDLEDDNRVDMFANTSFSESHPKLSPNGVYVAYASRESGNLEVYVRRFDGTGGKWQISTESANYPTWSSDGTELFYLTPESQLVAVPVSTQGEFEAGQPEELWELPVRRVGNINTPYLVSDDSQRFLVNVNVTNADPGKIVLVQNWAEEFKPQ